MTKFTENFWKLCQEIMTTEIIENEQALEWLKDRLQISQLSKQVRDRVLIMLAPLLIENLSEDKELQTFKTIISVAPLAKEILKSLSTASPTNPKPGVLVENELKEKLGFTNDDFRDENSRNLFYQGVASGVNILLAEELIIPTDVKSLRPPLYISLKGERLLRKLKILEELRKIVKEFQVK